MTRATLALLLSLAAAPAGAFDKFGIIAVADPPGGPDADLAELAHQLRGACRDRIGGIEEVPTMRARLLGQTSNATLSELDRAYGGALAVYQNGEFDSALRTLHAIVEDLENLPETDESYSQWVRAQLRLAHAAFTVNNDAAGDAALYALAKTDIRIVAEPDQYSPTYRRRFDGIKAKVKALPARRLTVSSEGAQGTVFVNGRPMGTTPLALWLPAGQYRIGGAADELRVPSFRVDLRNEDRAVVLDFALAESLRVNAGPGLALPVSKRGDGIVRAGAWLGVDRVITVSRVFEGQAAFLLGSIYDVRRGALLREGSVRMVAGSVPAANLGALAAFLLTGQSSRDVKDRTEVARERAQPIAAADPAPSSIAPPVATAAPTTPAPEPQPVAISPAPAASASTTAPPSVAGASTTAAAAPGTTAAALPATSKSASAKPQKQVVAATAAAAKPQQPSTNAKAAKDASAPAAAAPGASPTLAAASHAEKPSPPSLSAVPPRSLDAVPTAVATDPGRRAPSWMRPAAIGSGVAAGLFAALAVQQGLSARGSHADADAMLQGGVFLPGTDPARYDELQREGDGAKRNAYISAGAAVVFAAAAGYLGWRSIEPADATVGIRF